MTTVKETPPNPPTSQAVDRPALFSARGLPLVWRLAVAAVLLVTGWVLAPSLSSHQLYVGTAIIAWALVASSLNIVVGYAGQLNLAQGGFLALGAYVGVLGTGRWDWNGLLTLAVAAGIAFVVASLLGRIIFRAKGLHFALLTTGISIVVYNVLIAWSSLTGGAAGISTAGPLEEGGTIKPLTVGGLELRTAEDYFRVMFVCLVLLVLAVTIVRRRKTGLSWQAIRDNEVLGASVGVDVAKGKRTAFVTSSVLAALIGVMFGHWLGYITPGSFDFAKASFEPLAMVIIGGAGTLLGPILGAIIVIGLPEVFVDLEDYSTFVYGIVLLIVVMVAPKGIVGESKDAIEKYLTSRRKGRR
jgi:ABC-type branched-subunit amino acid transport system permease subunit